MLSKKLNEFLQAQKGRLLTLDEAEGTTRDKSSPKYFDEKQQKVVSGIEVLYDNTISWLNGKEGFDALWQEFGMLEQLIKEDTLATAAPQFTTFLLPIVRRMYHNLIAQDLISIQPMTGPSAYIYYLDKLYTNTTAEVTAGQRTDQQTPRLYPASGEATLPIRELQMRLQRLLIEASTDKLKADWTLEAEQDWSAQYKIGVESEMVPELGDEIARELDRKILDALIAGAAHAITWNPTGYLAGDIDSAQRRAYRAGIYDTLVDAKAEIETARNRVGCDWWCVMHPRTWARFRKLEQFNMDVVIDQKAAIGRRYEGVINDLWKVYINPEFNECYILAGVKKDWLHAVGYYAPYVPLYTSPKYIINDDFTHYARGVMSRYAYGVLPNTSTGTTNDGLALINICPS